MKQADAIAVVTEDLLPAYQHERERLDKIDKWYRWHNEDPPLPRKATRELRQLRQLAKTPWLGLVVTTVAQSMYVDGFRSIASDGTAAPDVQGPWQVWAANDFDHRQTAVHRAALGYGYSFVTVALGDPTVAMRGVSPRHMFARYDEPDDDWPRFALKVHTQPDKSLLLRLYDEAQVYYLGSDSAGGGVHFIEGSDHRAGVCPVVRYANMLDLEGRVDGEVEPFIGVAARIDKTAFDRLLTQHFSSWKIRTIAGMAEPDNQEEANLKKLQLRQDDVLVADDADTKFGTLDETPLDGFLAAWRADIEALAAVTQTPSHNLTGQLVNLSAEALAAARASLTQKVTERQKAFGKSHTQALRLAAHLLGDDAGAQDVHARVTWQDMEIRSMSQAVDALGKAAQMLQIPADQLWGRIPGVEQADVDEWRRAAIEQDPITKLQYQIEQQATQPPPAAVP